MGKRGGREEGEAGPGCTEKNASDTKKRSECEGVGERRVEYQRLAAAYQCNSKVDDTQRGESCGCWMLIGTPWEKQEKDVSAVQLSSRALAQTGTADCTGHLRIAFPALCSLALMR